MKILFITIENNPLTLGGVQTFARAMKKLYKKELVFLTNKFKLKPEYIVETDVDDIIEVYSSNIFFRAINKIFKNKIRKYMIIKKIKELRPDICILSNDNELEYLNEIDTKVICVQHNSADNNLFQEKNFYRKESFYKNLRKRKLDCMVCLCQKDVVLFKKMAKDIEKNITIRFPNFIKLLEEKKIQRKNLIMLTRLQNHQKKIDLAIKAMKKLPDFTLDIYGEGPDKENYQHIISGEKIENVFLRGTTTNVQEKLDEAGIFIMTSDYEGYPVSSIEAMRRGLPIILRNTFGAASDIVVDNKNGILLEREWNEDKFVEAVRKVYDNYEYYSKNSKKFGERYSPEVVKKEWDNLFEELINEKRR